MTSSRPFPPFISGWSPPQRSRQPLRPWLTRFWQAPSHHSKQFTHLCAAKRIGQLPPTHAKRQTHEAITHLINEIACLNTKGQLSTLHPPLPNPHVVIAVDRNWANTTCSKFAATARDALLRLTHVPRPSPPQVGLKPRSRKACRPSVDWASKSRSSMAAARKPALADPSSLATSVGQVGNAMCEPAALNQRAAHAATSAGDKTRNGDTCARRDSSPTGTISTGLPATDGLDIGSGMTTAPSPAQRITSSKLVVKPGRTKSAYSMRHAQAEIAGLAMSSLLTGLRRRGQLGPKLQSKHRGECHLHCSRNPALLPVAHAAYTFCSREAKQPGKFRRPSVVSNEFNIGHRPMLHIECIFINLFV